MSQSYICYEQKDTIEGFQGYTFRTEGATCPVGYYPVEGTLICSQGTQPTITPPPHRVIRNVDGTCPSGYTLDRWGICESTPPVITPTCPPGQILMGAGLDSVCLPDPALNRGVTTEPPTINNVSDEEIIRAQRIETIIYYHITGKKYLQLMNYIRDPTNELNYMNAILYIMRQTNDDDILIDSVLNYINNLPIPNNSVLYQSTESFYYIDDSMTNEEKIRTLRLLDRALEYTYGDYIQVLERSNLENLNNFKNSIKNEIRTIRSDNGVINTILNLINRINGGGRPRGRISRAPSSIIIRVPPPTTPPDTTPPDTAPPDFKENEKDFKVDESELNIGDQNTEFIAIDTKNTIAILDNIKSIDECNVQCFTNSDCKKYTYSQSLETCKLSNEYGILSKSEDIKAEWTTRLVMEPFENVEKCENNDYAPLLIFIILLLAVILCLFSYK